MQLKLVTVNFQLSSPQSWWWGSHGIYCVFRQKCPQKTRIVSSGAALPHFRSGQGEVEASSLDLQKGFGEHLELIYALILWNYINIVLPPSLKAACQAHDPWLLSHQHQIFCCTHFWVTQPYNPHFGLAFFVDPFLIKSWLPVEINPLWIGGPLFSSPISWAVFRFARRSILRQPTCYLSTETRLVEKEFKLGVKDKYSEIFDNYEGTPTISLNGQSYKLKVCLLK